MEIGLLCALTNVQDYHNVGELNLKIFTSNMNRKEEVKKLSKLSNYGTK
jgi:hypothetical protein